MKKNLIFFILLSGLILLSACTSAAPETIELGAKDSGTTIYAKRGDTLKITLISNPTTGHVWKSAGTPDMEVLRLVHEEFLAPPRNGMTGVPGKKIFCYKAVEPGRAGISLAYRRPWEQGPPSEVFQVRVIVLKTNRPFGKILDMEYETPRVGSRGQIEPRVY